MRYFLTAPGVTSLWMLAVLSAAPRDAQAQLAHRYSFTTDASDSIGGAHGTLLDPGVQNGFFVDGQLDLSSNPAEGSNAIVEAAYVDLPNGLISGAANAGVSGAITLEFWATVSTTRTWQRFGDFGTSNDGEDTSNGGGTSKYLIVTPNSGRFGNGLEITNHTDVPEEGQPIEPNVGVAGTFPLDVEQHVVAVYDHNDTTAGPNGTMTLYLNGTLVGSNIITPGFDLNTLPDVNNWLGRAQWPDPIFTGKYNEFRIYSDALTATEAATSSFFGPDVLNPGELLSLEVDSTSGDVTLKNNASVPLEIDFYRVSSAESALSVNGWNSFDDQNYDAVDGDDAGTVGGDSVGEGWDESGGSNASQLVEYFLAAEGSTIGANQSLTLGNAYNTSVFGGGNDGDLQFAYGLVGGLELTGNVNYVAGPAVAGDYNGNGVVDAADYTVWRDTLNQSGPDLAADGNDDGTVNEADYTFWKTRFGNTSGSGLGSASNVPEPTSLVLVLIAASMVARLRQRRGCAVG